MIVVWTKLVVVRGIRPASSMIQLYPQLANIGQVCGSVSSGVGDWRLGGGANREIDFGFGCGCVACVRAKLCAGV